MIRPVNPQAIRQAPTLDLPPAVLAGALEAIRASGRAGRLPGAWLDADVHQVAAALEAAGYVVAWAEYCQGVGFEVVTDCALCVTRNGSAGEARGRRAARLEVA